MSQAAWKWILEQHSDDEVRRLFDKTKLKADGFRSSKKAPIPWLINILLKPTCYLKFLKSYQALYPSTDNYSNLNNEQLLNLISKEPTLIVKVLSSLLVDESYTGDIDEIFQSFALSGFIALYEKLSSEEKVRQQLVDQLTSEVNKYKQLCNNYQDSFKQKDKLIAELHKNISTLQKETENVKGQLLKEIQSLSTGNKNLADELLFLKGEFQKIQEAENNNVTSTRDRVALIGINDYNRTLLKLSADKIALYSVNEFLDLSTDDILKFKIILLLTTELSAMEKRKIIKTIRLTEIIELSSINEVNNFLGGIINEF